MRITKKDRKAMTRTELEMIQKASEPKIIKLDEFFKMSPKCLEKEEAAS